MADGGEGTLEALGGPNRTTTVTGPLGAPVDAAWRLDGRTAVIEMAAASGLALVGGAEANDPVAASTVGTGELIVAALDVGARRVIVGLGGSATTDGGLGALRALHPLGRLKGIELVVACDSRVPFLDAADGLRAAEGRHARAGRAPAPAPRAPGAGVPRRARRRRARPRGGRGGRGPRRRPGGGRRRARERVRPRGRRGGARRAARRRRPRDHRRGLPRRAELRGQGRGRRRVPRRARSVCRWWRSPDRSTTAAGDRIEAVSLVDRFGEARAWDGHPRVHRRRSPPTSFAGRGA